MRKILAVLGMATLAAACSDVGPGGARTVSLSFTTGSGAAPLFSSTGVADDVFTSGSDVLVISQAQVVLREIELKRENNDVCDAGMNDDDGCEEFETGPMLVNLPLGGAVTTEVTIAIEPGTYDRIDFEVHKTEGSGDAAFIAANPQFDGLSIRVEGTWNGTTFVYTSDLDVEQENRLVQPLLIDAAGPTNVTLRVDLSTWFRNQSGVLVDPASANKGGANESIVKENVKNSFKAFEDRDRDGDDSDES
ncbi:MAG: hypothetical protein OER21_02410 [Gemmatimonadota bacterium]|nr:hypothetical protein [Gemmatimonadota bacterium]